MELAFPPLMLDRTLQACGVDFLVIKTEDGPEDFISVFA